MSAVEMHSKMNVAYQAGLTTIAALDDAIAYFQTHNGSDGLVDLQALKDAMLAPMDAIKEDLETYTETEQAT